MNHPQVKGVVRYVPPVEERFDHEYGGGLPANLDITASLTAIKIFRRFMKRLPDGSLDVSGVNSRECYETWLSSRKSQCKNPEAVFQRTLTAHLGAVDGRQPFTAEEEFAILKWLRTERRWPCFENSEVRFGKFGFRGKGYHEKLLLGQHGKDDRSGDDESDQSEYDTDRGIAKRVKFTYGDSNSAPPEPHRGKGEDEDGTHAKHQSIKRGESENERIRKMYEDIPEPLLPLADYSSLKTVTLGYNPTRLNAAKVTAGMRDPSMRGGPNLAAPVTAMPLPPVNNSKWDLFNIHTIIASFWVMMSKMGDPRLWFTLVMGYARYKLLTRDWTDPPSMEDAIDRLRDWDEKYPDHAINVYDMTCPDAADRIMVQNSLSEQLFGCISRTKGKIVGKRFHPDDTLELVKIIAHAFTYRNTEIPFHIRWILVDGSTLYFDSIFYVDDKARMLLERKRISPNQTK